VDIHRRFVTKYEADLREKRLDDLFKMVTARLDRVDNRMDNVLGYEKSKEQSEEDNPNNQNS
jgi:hypothetical protein